MTLKRIISIPLIFFVVVSVMSTFAQENDDYNALVAFYNSTNGDDWAENTDWLVDPNVCNWFGITCDIEGKVISIDFKPTLDNSGTFISTDIIGSIPPEIGDLVYLEELIIWNADFSGSGLPNEIGNLSNLIHLELVSSSLSGEIPASIGNLTNLEIIDLSVNQLTGSIPPELAALTNLRGLALQNNQLMGTIPVELAQIQTLEYVYLDVNALEGEIPTELALLDNLMLFSASYNQLTGTIPSSFGSAPSLVGIGFNQNQLTGSIPPELGDSNTLQYIELALNQLEGTIPNELANLDLVSLRLNDNNLSGTIPVWLGNQTNLEYLMLDTNRFTGYIPPELGNLVNLQEISFGNNALIGEIPASFANLVNLYFEPVNNGINFGFNALYATDADLITFFESNIPEWDDSQTVAPTNISIVATTTDSITVSWDAIQYTEDGGYYQVITFPIINGCMTTDKTETSCEVTGLRDDIDYFIHVQTFTPAHGVQQNDVWSETSEAIIWIRDFIRGDCNGDMLVDDQDLSAIQLEIFDEDSDSVSDDISNGFAGNPFGCDANADTIIDAGDLSCTQNIILDENFICGVAP